MLETFINTHDTIQKSHIFQKMCPCTQTTACHRYKESTLQHTWAGWRLAATHMTHTQHHVVILKALSHTTYSSAKLFCGSMSEQDSAFLAREHSDRHYQYHQKAVMLPDVNTGNHFSCTQAFTKDTFIAFRQVNACKQDKTKDSRSEQFRDTHGLAKSTCKVSGLFTSSQTWYYIKSLKKAIAKVVGLKTLTFHMAEYLDALYCDIFSLSELENVLLAVDDRHRTVDVPLPNIPRVHPSLLWKICLDTRSSKKRGKCRTRIEEMQSGA